MSECLHQLDLDRFYRIYTTVYEMLGDRGYTPVESKLNKKKWISRYLGYLAELEDDSSEMDIFGIIDKMLLLFSKGKKLLLVYFHPLNSKLCQSDMNYIHNLLTEKKAQHLIIVANNRATPKVFNVLGIIGPNAQLFSENELMFNVTRHQLVPKHTRLDGSSRESVIKTFTTLPDGKQHLDLFPGMFTNDPIAKYYNFKVNDIIHIERPRKDGFFDISYRTVIYPITDKDKK